MNRGLHLATKTKAKIDSMIESDQGGSYREWLGKVLPHIGDAYSPDSFPFRSHMGASLIGGECPRSIWYSFRWTKKPKFSGRMIRLFNRGHLEEGRFIAQLLMIGCQVYQQDQNGKQYRISSSDGHFGGSGDGVVVGLPDLDSAQACLLEFKTHSEKSFKKLVDGGVKEAKFEHYVQMNLYMYKMGLAVALYGAVNKNTDEEHWELVTLDSEIAMAYLDRADKLIAMTEAPKRISNSPGFWKCKFCDLRPVCHLNETPEINCRTCKYSKVAKEGNWVCTKTLEKLTKQQQYEACEHYYLSEGFTN